jgi:uncharacterized protein (DUF736 family)
LGKYIIYCTDFLFARPSFLTGLARTLDLHGLFDQYNRSDSEQEADFRALLCDWLVTQQDISLAWAQIVRENPDYIQDLTAAISSDPYLSKVVARLAAEEKQHELQMATQGA